MLKILLVSAEVYPFTKTGGLGDVCGALPKYLKELGHDVRVMMPNYKAVNERKYVLRDVIRLQGLQIRLGAKAYEASAKSAFIPDSKVQVYFLHNKHFFERNGLYADERTGEDFADNAERFTFFAAGCLETLKLLYWQPDIIHCNDWQAAMLPVLLKTVYKDDTFFDKTRVLFAVHDFAKQGCVDPSGLKALGLFDRANHVPASATFLQLGLEHADYVSTVSETYLSEVLALADKNDALGVKLPRQEWVGIRNGIDEGVWNPETDRIIPHNYSRRDLSGKEENKRKLLEEFGLEARGNVPLIGLIAQLDERKGADLLLEAAPALLAKDLRLIVVGRGKPEFEKQFQSLQKRYPGRLGLHLGFDHELSHRLMAGCDFYLMPSRSEPCGLHQLYALAYGTIPIVRVAGGLAETVQAFDPASGSGTGFRFAEPSAEALVAAVEQAIAVYQDEELRGKLVKNAMKQDVSWKGPARKYVKLYQKIMNSKTRRKKAVVV